MYKKLTESVLIRLCGYFAVGALFVWFVLHKICASWEQTAVFVVITLLCALVSVACLIMFLYKMHQRDREQTTMHFMDGVAYLREFAKLHKNDDKYSDLVSAIASVLFLNLSKDNAEDTGISDTYKKVAKPNVRMQKVAKKVTNNQNNGNKVNENSVSNADVFSLDEVMQTNNSKKLVKRVNSGKLHNTVKKK